MQFKIKSVRVKNFKCFNNSKYYEFNIDDTKNPIILTGPNGFGKTTFFDAIELVFSKKITRFNVAIENKGTDLQKNVLLNEADSDGYIVCTLIDENRECLSLFAKIDHGMHKVSYIDSIYYGLKHENISSEALNKEISSYSDWRESISDFSEIKYSAENFAVYYYVSQAESVHFLKQSIAQRKDALNVLLDIGDVDEWGKFLQNNIIGIRTSSSNVLINDEIKLLDEKIKNDVNQLKDLGNINEIKDKPKFFSLIKMDNLSSVPIWDEEKIDDVDNSDLEKGIIDIDRITSFVKNYEDYQRYLWNNQVDSSTVKGVDDLLLCSNFIENEKINQGKIRSELTSKNRLIEIFNKSLFLREKDIVPENYDVNGLLRLKEIIPECVLFDIEEVKIICNKLDGLSKTLSSKQAVIKKLEEARTELCDANNRLNENNDRCPYCGHSYGKAKLLDEAYNAAHALLETENGKELNEYNLGVRKLKDIIKESQDALYKEIGSLDDNKINEMLDEIAKLTSFISDKNRVDNVNFIVPLAKVNIIFEDLQTAEQKRELQRILIAAKKTYVDENFANNLVTYDYNTLLKEYKNINWKNQKFILDTEKVDDKKSYIKFVIDAKNNKKVGEINTRIKGNIRRWLCLKKVRDDLKNIQKLYSDSVESYKNQILSRLRVPLLIYTGKILQDYQNGLGVFISKDEMRFVTNGDVKHDILNTFSSGQLSGFVLAFLFSMNKLYVKESEDDFGFILIDDPVQTMDDINISSMIEVLRNDFIDRQIILSTHETDKENYILYKFFKYNKIGQSFNVKEQLYGV